MFFLQPIYAGVMAAFEDADFTISFHREDTTTGTHSWLACSDLNHLLAEMCGTLTWAHVSEWKIFTLYIFLLYFILAHEATPNRSSSGTGQTLRGVVASAELTPADPDPSSASSSSPGGQPLPLPPGHQQCSYCGSVMPSLRLLMHERHCLQSTFKCPLCK